MTRKTTNPASLFAAISALFSGVQVGHFGGWKDYIIVGEKKIPVAPSCQGSFSGHRGGTQGRGWNPGEP